MTGEFVIEKYHLNIFFSPSTSSASQISFEHELNKKWNSLYAQFKGSEIMHICLISESWDRPSLNLCAPAAELTGSPQSQVKGWVNM